MKASPMTSSRLFAILALGALPAAADPSAADRLRAAKSWMYQIQDIDRKGAVEALAGSAYDLLVVEPTDTNRDTRDWDGKGMVPKLKAGKPGRLVLAYVDIGEAESYRTYWGKDWKAPTKKGPGIPEFLLAPDPDGWAENYPVAYWDPRWRAIVAEGPESLVGRALADGFDGVYMDWVEAYDDDRVRKAAKKAGIDPERAMTDFILAIRESARKTKPDFLLIAQNAPYLIDADPRYAGAIDGMAAEDTWFRGEADAKWKDPKGGDIPNREKDEGSTAARIRQFHKYKERGLPVFTCDYSLNPETAAAVYAASRKEGFIPLVTRVSLARMTETPPP